MSPFFIDFHCHPSMKPYGKSFNEVPGENSSNPQHKNSCWFYDSPNLFERGLQLVSGISKFTQADFSTLAFGNVRLIFASLYPIERGFFKNDLGQGIISDVVNNFVTGVGDARVDHIQKTNNYFEDLLREYQFYLNLHEKPVETISGEYKYVMVNSFAQIQQALETDSMRNNIIFVVMSIEGLHVLNDNLKGKPDEQKFLANLRTIKNWQFPPAFVTFSHHFYNHLCGHAKSLTGIVGKATNQSNGLNTGFTDLGRKVLTEALNETNGRRIHIDIKHMSAQSRKEYFDILKTEYADQDIPTVVSHGAANGMRSMSEKITDNPITGPKLLREDINFYDNEIIEVARGNGIFGLQLDERRIANKHTLKSVKHSVFINKIRHYRAELLWNQIQHIGELLDKHDLPAWDCLAIGSDFEGIIDPLNGYLTAETMVHLEEFTERHAYNYLQNEGKKLKPYNQIPADELVNRIFHSNGWDFLKRYF